MSERGSTNALREFLRLSRQDQSAIAKRLSPEQRQRLLALKEKGRPLAAQQPQEDVNSPDWSVYSPWLAMHLVRVVADAEAGRSRLTPAAQATLHKCLSRSRPAQ